MKEHVVMLARALFFIYAFFWILRPRKATSMKDVLHLFYMDFLRLKERDVEVVKLDDQELVTRCSNPCPILNLALLLRLDTRYVCRAVSEPVCRYVIRKLNPRLRFERNYEHIRPYKGSCEERIYWTK